MNRKLRLTILTLAFTLLFCSITTFAYSTFNKLNVSGIFYSTKESNLEISSLAFSNDEIEGICLMDTYGNAISSEFELTGNTLRVNPLKDLNGDSNYFLRIFTNDKWYEASLIATDIINIDNSKESIIKISPKPDKGFNYPYYLLIPAGTQSDTSSKYMVVEPNNSGIGSDSMEAHEIEVKINLHDYGDVSGGAGGYKIATNLKSPLLIPVFTRPATPDLVDIYTHALNKVAMDVKNEKYERVDKQMVAMINHAKELLAENEIILEDKVFMVGFSASGDFVTRFSIMYPEMVKAYVSSASTTFPAREYNGITLNYPIGVNDIKNYTGKEFNSAGYKKIAKYMYMGEHDTNDFTYQYDDNGQDYVSAVRAIFKNEEFPYKWNRRIKIINEL